jgi:hypothetical protein
VEISKEDRDVIDIVNRHADKRAVINSYADSFKAISARIKKRRAKKGAKK